MRIFKNIKYNFSVASDRTRREIVVILILLLVSMLVNIPSLIENIRVYYGPK